ncbi:SDR family oxidoreductase [Haloarculaceae archaeon H-GB2-1]|nr:SDR family oxidoreductase [Haloarculaceae archaeon H-GB1-1]MEA5387827.1 SDR family oxidoreductase [Haloarculaceae archaeon H-GB11]MEA5409327.1 SDR family oxidoreductase [Haloarculaceae archaeon H-GB2-1]
MGSHSLDGAVVLVTGATSGIGEATARGLAERGATVLLHGRDRRKGERVVDRLAAETGADDLALYTADFADLDAVRSLADAVLADYDRLDVLVNNAGTWQEKRRLTDDGIEYTFAVNHFAPFLLTALLRGRLAASGTVASDASPPDGPSRVVTVSSGLHSRATMDFDAIRGPDGPAGIDAYATSKLANVLFTSELARRLPKTVTANCLHPGVVPSTALARAGSGLSRLVWKAMGVVGSLVPFGPVDSAAEAARTSIYLASSPDVADVTGEYFVDCQPRRSSAESRDRETQRRLWEVSEALVGLE